MLALLPNPHVPERGGGGQGTQAHFPNASASSLALVPEPPTWSANGGRRGVPRRVPSQYDPHDTLIILSLP